MLFEHSILTAAEMRAAEAAVIERGISERELMERAGAAAAEAIWLYAGPLPTLILCGPGNNGGDGKVVARLLRERGVEVEVAELGDLEAAAPKALLVDALFGTGLSRGLDQNVAAQLARLADAAVVKVALDLPSGVSADDGAPLSPLPDYDLTIAFGAFKPAHFLQPAAGHMGRLVLADIGIPVESRLQLLGSCEMRRPGADDHKYSRGYVAVVAGEMPGAAALAAGAAAKAGAGYVRLVSDRPIPGAAHAIVQSPAQAAEILADPRIGAVLIGPGLGRGAPAGTKLNQALALGRPLVLDGDALWLMDGVSLSKSPTAILTPHAGEFDRLFGRSEGGKIGRSRAAAAASGAVIVHKGADTVIAAPDGRTAIARPGSSWLASAGTGDVLAGIIAAARASGLEAYEAACTGVWLHARAAERAGAGLIADDLLQWL